jgi:hypothetical protein
MREVRKVRVKCVIGRLMRHSPLYVAYRVGQNHVE